MTNMRTPLKTLHIAGICVLIAGLTACVTTEQADPVGIGRDTDEYKQSPCACLEIEQPAADTPYLERLRLRLSTPPSG